MEISPTRWLNMLDRWLDVTPTSRVIARCTQDIQAGAYTIRLQGTQTTSLILACSAQLMDLLQATSNGWVCCHTTYNMRTSNGFL